MKIKYKFLVFNFFWFISMSFGQDNGMICNYNFEKNFCNNVPCLGNLYPDCVPNWYTSHGTPYIFGPIGTYNDVAYMWYGGEGIFAEVNFKAGRSYNICLRVRADQFPTPTEYFPNMENVFVSAANVSHSPSSDPNCGEQFSPIGQVIYSAPFSDHFNNFVLISVNDFVPTIDYRNLLITHTAFPQMKGFGLPLGIYVDEVQVHENCIELRQFQNEEVEGETANVIKVIGNSSSPSDQNITLKTSKSLRITGNFVSSPDEIGSLWLKSGDCEVRCSDENFELLDNGEAVTRSAFPQYELPSMEPSEKISSDISIFPNPTSGNILLQYQLESYSTVQFRWTSMDGKSLDNTLMSFEKEEGNHTQSFDLSDFPDGVYYLTIQTPEWTVVKKVVKI